MERQHDRKNRDRDATPRNGIAPDARQISVGAAAGGLGILVDGGASIERLAMFGYPEEIVEGTRFLPLDALGPIATMARTGESVWLETTVELFSRYPELGTIPARRQFDAAVSVPLSAGGRVIGVIMKRSAPPAPRRRRRCGRGTSSSPSPPTS